MKSSGIGLSAILEYDADLDSILFENPSYWAQALCRGDGVEAWMLQVGGRTADGKRRLRDLRAVCAQCPAAGSCLRDAIAEPPMLRDLGPVRLGLSGKVGFDKARRLVAELEPVTDEDWEQVAAIIVDEPELMPRKKGKQKGHDNELSQSEEVREVPVAISA